MLCHACQHFGANFVAVMEGENNIRPPIPSKCLMRTCLSLDLPTKLQEGAEL